MGNKIEVWAYLPRSAGGYEYTQVYGGESWLRAILEARRAKRTAGCVKVEWR